MKTYVLAALLASTSAIEVTPVRNPHLMATYILNDAVSLVEETGRKERLAESVTNTDYVKELDKELLVLNKERMHVTDGESIAASMLTTSNKKVSAPKVTAKTPTVTTPAPTTTPAAPTKTPAANKGFTPISKILPTKPLASHKINLGE